MGNLFVDLPCPAGNGAGAWVDVSGFGALKTISVVGNGALLGPAIAIECSNQTVPTEGFPLATFQFPSEETLYVATMWMRAVVQNYKSGGAPTVSVGGTDDGTANIQIAVPATNGSAAASNTSTLPTVKTVQVVGGFTGRLNFEISEDGATYSQSFSFQNPGGQTEVMATTSVRTSRNGVTGGSTPEVWMCTTGTASGGGGGGGTQIKVVYTADGAEGTDFMVTIGSTLTNSLYGVTAQPSGMVYVPMSIDLPIADRTTTQFRVVLSAPLQSGDQVTFMVFPQ